MKSKKSNTPNHLPALPFTHGDNFQVISFSGRVPKWIIQSKAPTKPRKPAGKQRAA